MAVTCIYRCLQFRSLANCYLPIAYEGEGIGTDIGIKLLPVMWVFSAFQDTSTVREVQQWHNVLHITIRACFLCFFYNPYMSLFNSFTCLHSFFTCLKIACLLLLRQPRFLTYGKSVGLCTNEMCAHFCNSPNCCTDSNPQNVLTCNLGSGQEAVATRFNRPRSRGATKREIALLCEAT